MLRYVLWWGIADSGRIVCELEFGLDSGNENGTGNGLRIGIRIDLRIGPIWSIYQARSSPDMTRKTSRVAINTCYFPISGYSLRIRRRI